MNKKHSFRAFVILLAMIPSLWAHSAFAGANFTITPAAGVPFPSTIVIGQTVSAYYTVTNNTSSSRIGYFVQGLPSSVTQETSAVGECSSPVILAAYAQCTLKLNITKPVKSSFALCKGSSCTTAAVPLNVRQGKAPSSTSFLAAAGAALINGNAYPLILQSLDGGVNWSVVTVPNAPLGILRSVSCIKSGNGAICVAVGGEEVSTTSPPALIQSTDGGVNWHVVTVPNISSGFFRSTTCTGDGTNVTCVAVGENSTDTTTLLVQSIDGGANWSVVPSPQNPGDRFYGTSCSGSGVNTICTAVGDNSNNSTPLIFQTVDNGIVWSTVSLPLTLNGILYGTSCTGSGASAICTAVGQNSATSNLLLIQSQDGGANWSIVDTSGLPNGIFYSTSCTGSGSSAICVAVGKDNNNLPLIFQSTDGGDNWSAVVQAFPNGLFDSVSCTGSGASAICVAGGENTTNNTSLLVQSTNGGSNWSIVTALPNIPDSAFRSVSCSGSEASAICVAAGDIIDKSLLAQSTNGGLNWSIVTVPGIPDISGLSGAGGTSASFLPDSLKFLSESSNEIHSFVRRSR